VLHSAESLIFATISANLQSYAKWFNPLISDPSGIDWWKKPKVENLVRLSLWRGSLTKQGHRIIPRLPWRGEAPMETRGSHGELLVPN
jgi:hypothetical protein